MQKIRDPDRKSDKLQQLRRTRSAFPLAHKSPLEPHHFTRVTHFHKFIELALEKIWEAKHPAWLNSGALAVAVFGGEEDGDMLVTKKASSSCTGGKKMAEVKAAASAGLNKAKVAAAVGAQNVKIGTSVGTKWVKKQYQKKHSS